MEITKKIDAIIDRRIGRNGFEGKGHLNVIQKQQTFFKNMEELMDEYSVFRSNVLRQIEEQKGEYYMMSVEDPTLKDNVESTDPSKFIHQLQKCQKECERLEKRFNRDTINISVVGRARQGKSRLLQSISGLKDEVIPASNGGDCTGAKSVIVNNNGQTFAKVIFYNEQELVSQIQKYLNEIGISQTLGSLSQIKNLKSEIKIFESNLSSKTGKQQSLFQHLKKYVEHYDEYVGYVGSVRDNVAENNIRNFVAQYDDKGNYTYEYLAVKEVLIYTQFPVNDAGKIVLVDTIGLGDTSIGIQDKMINTLRDDSDAAILVRLPSSNGDNIRAEDDELYDLIVKAMGLEVLNKWLFFALNVCEELGNHNSGKTMEDSLKARKLNYAFIKKVNCGNTAEVEQKLLVPILEYLTENLSEVDNNLMKSANKEFEEAYQKYYELCTKIGKILSGGFKKNLQSGGLFDDLYTQLELSRALNDLQTKYSDLAKECVEIREEIENVIKNIGNHCPTTEDIMLRLTKGDDTAYSENVYNYFADELRTVVREDFENINRTTIVKLQDEFKDEICNALRAEKSGKLGKVPMKEDFTDDNNVEWLGSFIAEKLENYPLISDALKDIYDYRLNIEGLLGYKADKALATLDPTIGNEKFIRLDFKNMDCKEIVEIIEQALLNAIPIIADEMLESIKELLIIPVNAFHAKIHTLRDRIILNEDGKRELKNLYREFATIIWAEEFKNIANKEVALGQLNEINTKIQEKNKQNLFVLKLS